MRDASSSIRSVSRSPDPFGCPSRSYPRSPHGARGRLRFFHSEAFERGSFRARLSTITIAPVRSPARWSRSRTVFLFSPFGAESPFCVHSRLGVPGSCSCSLHLAAFRARPRPCPPRDVRACFTTIHLAMNGMPASAPASRCSLARLGLAHLLGVRARSTFVNNLGRTSPPAMFARLTALGHFRRRCSTSAAPTFLVHPRHLAMPLMPAFVIASRRSCSRSHACAASRRFRDRSRHTCGARVCASPLLPSLFRAPASVPTHACVSQRSRRVRRWVLTFRLRRSRHKRRARLLGTRDRVRLSTFASAFTFGFRRRPFTLKSRAHIRLATNMTTSNSREWTSACASVLTSSSLLAKRRLALTTVIAVVDRLATIPRDHFRRLTVHGLAIYVSRFRRDEARTFRPCLRMTMTIAFRRPSFG